MTNLTPDQIWELTQLPVEEIIEMCKDAEVRVLNQFVMSTISMLSNGHDIVDIEARLQAAVEIAEGLGVEIEIPIGRRVLFQRIGKAMREKLDSLL